jgi:hypothetical protein
MADGIPEQPGTGGGWLSGHRGILAMSLPVHNFSGDPAVRQVFVFG